MLFTFRRCNRFAWKILYFQKLPCVYSFLNAKNVSTETDIMSLLLVRTTLLVLTLRLSVWFQLGKFGSDFHLMGQIVHTKNGQFCKPTSISYFRARDILRDGLSNYLQPGFNFGTHSLRTGAVSHAANSSQVPSSASDKHVGWKFKRSKFRYIQDNEHASSLVSRNLRSLINSM